MGGVLVFGLNKSIQIIQTIKMREGIMKIGSISVVASLLLATSAAMAEAPKADITAPVLTKAPYKYVKKPITVDDGSLHGYVRVHHIFDDDKDSAIGKVTGSTLGWGLGYGKEILSGLKVGAELYGVKDTGLTRESAKTPNIAYGQFLNNKKGGANLNYGYSWGAHIRYEGDNYKLQLARSQYDSPLTNIVQITHVPNMYEYARLDGKVLGGNASIGFINKMSYGSRSMADYSLIGEGTGTAGMFLSGMYPPGTAAPIKRGRYYSIDDTLDDGTTDSNGILQAGFEKKKGMWQFSVWDQYIDDVANNIYAQGSYKWPLGMGKAFKLSGHVWNQDISNSNYEEKFGGTMLGAEALLKWGKFVGKFAYETKDDGGLLNAWGANPGYTSSIFSRNQYRSDVNAYKATLVWMPMKGLKLVASHADYGQSTTIGKTSADDATETDLVIVYKPRPDLTFKLFNANRTSEYNGAGDVKRTMDHTRLIVNFAF